MRGEELTRKFQTLTRRIGERRSEDIAQVVSRIDDCENPAELSRLLTIDGVEARST